MLDYGAEHLKLRRLDMPRNFFSGNNCVAEYGQFPSNFLLGAPRLVVRYSFVDRCSRGWARQSLWRETHS